MKQNEIMNTIEKTEKNEKPNYKIWHFGKSKWDRVVDETFYAENDDDAYVHLQHWINDHVCFNFVQYYYSSICYVRYADGNGIYEDFDIEDMAARKKWRARKTSFLKKAFDEITFFFSYYFISRPKDLYYWIRDLVYLLKNKEAYSNQWNLDIHILDSIERNVPSLIKNSQSLAFLDEAIIKMHGNDPQFNMKKYHEEHCMGYPKEIEDLAIKIQNEEYNKLLLHVKLYKYYADFGHINFDNDEEVMFDKKWRSTLPFKKGTYDEIADYNKAIALAQDQWNKIWDWMKMYGQKLND